MLGLSNLYTCPIMSDIKRKASNVQFQKEDKNMINWKKVALFAGGTLFGTAGVKILASDDAKKVYTECTAAVLRAKDCVMKTVTTVQENAGDIYEDAKSINEERAAKKEAAEVEDAKEEADEAAAAEEAAEPVAE